MPNYRFPVTIRGGLIGGLNRIPYIVDSPTNNQFIYWDQANGNLATRQIDYSEVLNTPTPLTFNQGLNLDGTTVGLGGTLDGNIGFGLTEIDFINTAFLAFNIGTDSDYTLGNDRITGSFETDTYTGLLVNRGDRQSLSSRHKASARQGSLDILATTTKRYLHFQYSYKYHHH